jgi:hypothetical protein
VASRVRRPEAAPDPAAPLVGAELEGIGEGQVDAVVGVALTLFNGKIIDKMEVG